MPAWTDLNIVPVPGVFSPMVPALVGLWGTDGSSWQGRHVGCIFPASLAKFCFYCQNNSHVNARDKGTLPGGHELEGADVALLCKASAWKGGSVGRARGQAGKQEPDLLQRYPRVSLTKAITCCSPLLARCLCFHRWSLEMFKKRKKKKVGGLWRGKLI